MCVNRYMFPLVDLDNGKRKVMFNHGIIIENRDFTPINERLFEWRLGLKGLSRFELINRDIKKYGVVDIEKFVNVPCGKCEECLKSRARGWAFRILKEAEKYQENYFITFTYDDSNLPIAKNGFNTLVKDDISKFNKQLKTYLHRNKKNSDFRFYGVGEYGSNTLRPHYHVIYFNLPLDDLEFFKYDNGYPTFTSKFLSSIWKKGFISIGFVDIGSACYVARYVDKKQDRSKQEKEKILEMGVVPEFSNMSRRPGIGADYLEKIKSNIENGIYTISAAGNDFSIPIYYNKKVKDLLDPETLERYEKRNEFLIKNRLNNDLLLSDLLCTDLQSYYLAEDLFKKSCKKQRDNIKLF